MKRTIIVSALVLLGAFCSNAQDRLYSNEFPIGDVTLLDGPFKHARDLNLEVLLQYDVDRLLAPFRAEAGLPKKAEYYPNWAGLDGHIAGHYLTAMAMNWQMTGNPECLRRMNYMIDELAEVAAANTRDNASWGAGYIGGIPNSASMWSDFMKGEFRQYSSAWAPFYNIHKMYAGLRDAWLYCGNEKAKQLFLGFCDWAILVTKDLSDDQMEQMLRNEHGGMNEVLADAYAITGDAKYLAVAKRFSHKQIMEPLTRDEDRLDNLHANTQVPKAIGFVRIGELSDSPDYAEAGRFFWQTVSQNRSLAFGGNSRREHFPSAEACIDFVNDDDGPETCNSSNMLKLTCSGCHRRQSMPTSMSVRCSTTSSRHSTRSMADTYISPPPGRGITVSILCRTRPCGAVSVPAWRISPDTDSSYIRTTGMTCMSTFSWLRS